jgi:hypothetical protein
MSEFANLLAAWIGRQATPQALAWLDGQRAELARDRSAKSLAAAFGAVSRHMERTPLALDVCDLAMAEKARPGWQPAGLSLHQAARLSLLLEPGIVPGSFAQRLRALATTADLGELITIYKGLPLYPEPETLVPLATEGLRTSMRPVFEAVAHRNPFPAEHFPQSAWNQMVLKAMFIDSPLSPIVGLDQRWNRDLAKILVDYAHERWAAGRPVSPELWRGVGRFADAQAVGDIVRVLASDSVTAQRAAALALSESQNPAAAEALARRPDLAVAIATGGIDWNSMGNDTA